MSNQNKVFSFEFPTASSSASFLKAGSSEFASAHFQHPQNNGVVDKTRVLVAGTGSMTYDLMLLEYLEQKSAELCGVRVK